MSESTSNVKDMQYEKVAIAIRKLSPESGDIFTIQFPPDVEHEQDTEFSHQLSKVLPKGVRVLILREDTKADLIPESTLNALGYFRNVN